MSGDDREPASRLVTLPPGLPELTLGYGVARWAVRLLVQPNGPRAGRRFSLLDSQMRFLLWWYAVDRDGRWLYHHAVRRLAKGSGKSPFAAVWALAEFQGPVRVDRFDPTVPGGVVGKPQPLPWVQIAATSEAQTANTMRMVRAFAPKGSKIADEYGLDVGIKVYHDPRGGKLEVITSAAETAEGAESTAVVADETEHWLPSNGGPKMMETLSDNLTKSGSRMMETQNAPEKGRGSVAEASHDAWLAQEEGRTKAGARRTIYDARIAPPTTELGDEESLRSGLEHVYGDCWWVNVDDLIGKIWDPRSDVRASMRKYLNWITAPGNTWCDPDEWGALEDRTVTVAPDDEIVMFFDGSKSRDATALVGCRVADGHVFTLGVWEPDPSDPLDTVDTVDVDRIVRSAFRDFNVVAYWADVREWESWVNDEWPGRYRDRLEVWAVPSGRPPQPIAWDMRAHAYEFAKAAEACHADILAGGFTHDGNSFTTRHVHNAIRHSYRDAVTVRKESPDSSKKIDAAVCVIGARMLRRIVLSSDRRPSSKRAGVIW